LFGYSRQAYYKRKQSEKSAIQIQKQVISMVIEKRIRMPRLGTRKLYYLLESDFKELSIKVGRDKLFHILRVNNMLIKPKKSYTITTNSKHWLHKHKNQIYDLDINRPEQVLVSDITYINTKQGHNYLSLVTDAYSKKIMGYNLADNMKAEESERALNMAIKNCTYKSEPTIHHSDRGLQYCSTSYQKILEKNNIKPSMTEKYDPYENAIAERINGILKDEFNLDKAFDSFNQAKLVVDSVINIYNNERPHLSCNLLTPVQMHKQRNIKRKQWKKKTSKNKILEVQN